MISTQPISSPIAPSSGPEKAKQSTNTRLHGGVYPRHRPPVRRTGGEHSKLTAPMLATEASAQLRDRLLAELKDLGGTDEAALWAQQSLPEKNKLIAVDGEHIGEAFQARLASFAIDAADGSPIAKAIDADPAPLPHRPSQRERSKKASSKRLGSNAIDKSALALPEPRRIRDRDHVRYVAKQACLVCGRQPADAHHLRFTQSRALGRKVSDEFTVPLCRGHHREVHRCGDETAWWSNLGIDPTGSARILWLRSHPLPPRLRNKKGDKPPIKSGIPTPNP